MKTVIDTNVLISGIFFTGPPSKILDACFTGMHEMVVSPEILEEYVRVGTAFGKQRSNTGFERVIALILSVSLLVETKPGTIQVCVDPDDDKFIQCALSAGASHIVSGDRHLLAVSSQEGIEVMRPREFVNKYIKENI